MAKVTGLGGVFFKVADPTATNSWFAEHLHIGAADFGTVFTWRDRDAPETKGYTVMSPFKQATDYFDPSPQPFMLNFRVDDLDGLLAELKAKGMTILKIMDSEPNGKFAHVMGPDGIKIELWEPVADDPYDP